MRVAAGAAAFLLFSSMSLVAQDSRLSTTTIPESANTFCETGNVPNSTQCKTTVVEGCPVDMRVRQRMAGSTVVVDANGVKRNVSAQRLRLFLNDLRPDHGGRKAVSATVTVYGTGDKARMQALGLQALDSSSGNHTRVKTLHVDLAGWDEPGASGDLLLPGFTSSSRVALESVTYDDGATWKLSNNEACRVAVDPMMLINR